MASSDALAPTRYTVSVRFEKGVPGDAVPNRFIPVAVMFSSPPSSMVGSDAPSAVYTSDDAAHASASLPSVPPVPRYSSALLPKFVGSGWPPGEFRRLFKQGKAGHAGLKESLALIAHCLGWRVETIVETGDAVVADHDIRTQHLEVKKGQTCGLHQRAEAKVDGTVRLTLDIKMYLDAANPRDAVQIEGDQATVAALVNTARGLLQAPVGLLLMTDLPVPRMG